MPSPLRRFAYLTFLAVTAGCAGGDVVNSSAGGSGDSGGATGSTPTATGSPPTSDTNAGTGSGGASADNGDAGTTTAVADSTASGGADESTGTTGGDGSTTGGGTTGGDTMGGSGSGSDGGMPCDTDDDCDDMQFCNGTETCGPTGFCVAGTNPDCDDGVACTVDACDETADACVSTASNAACSDGMYCNGAETCDPLAGCQAGAAPDCDDGVDCTMDSCDDTTAACVNAPDDSACDDGVFCNGAEVCDPTTGCQDAAAGADCDDLTACTTDYCDAMTDACVNDPDDTLCDNGLQCDGLETCVSGAGCVPGTAVSCPDDGFSCTEEGCSEGSTDDPPCVTNYNNATCVMAGHDFCTDAGCVDGSPCTADSDCNDGIACNGVETCDISTMPGTCQPGAVPNCDDMVDCTVDTCIELGSDLSTCDNSPSDVLCDDGNPCNGDETCSTTLNCVAGTAPNCDDSVGCTSDFCVPAAGCVHVPDDSMCDDGDVCNGPETCDVTADCQAGQTLVCPDDGYPCTNEACDSVLGGCITTPDDSMCSCGLYCDPTAPGVDGMGCTNNCSVALCDGTMWQCGNCIDDDMDCGVDSGDSDCFGVCDNNESGFNGDIPGQNSAPCKMDCYFDDDSGAGNDDCYWSHACDPLQPEPYSCECTPAPGDMFCDANIPGTQMNCDEAYMTQSTTCDDICGPVVPNGCDCFGCCEVTLPDMSQTTIYLGSEEPSGTPSCNASVLDNPLLCKPCTQVIACLNPCDTCELCFGETTLPPECGGVPTCPSEQQACGIPGLPLCPPGEYCLTGCCTTF